MRRVRGGRDHCGWDFWREIGVLLQEGAEGEKSVRLMITSLVDFDPEQGGFVGFAQHEQAYAVFG